jgi:hypothetical protein
MKNSISKSLSRSLEQERDRVQKLNLSKFDVADKVLIAQNTPTTKTIRDTFTLPEDDYAIIKHCRKRFLKQEVNVTKSEIIRIGLKVLEQMSDEEVGESYGLIRKIKIGRPKGV